MPAHFLELEREWRPEAVVDEDRVTALAPAAFAALLDQPSPVEGPGDVLPPLWHWFLFPRAPRSDELGVDGHPAHSALVPPLADRRRMFGGGRVRWHGRLRCGDPVRRVSRVADVRSRTGGSGPLLIVTVSHELSVAGEDVVVEEQDLVYRQAAPAAQGADAAVGSAGAATGRGAGTRTAAPQPPADGDWSLVLEPDPVLLFRFSALTWNAHRIHYDHPYATGVEGHPGLVVHGPLLALLLLELPRRHRPRDEVVELAWRARRPIHAGEQVLVRGDAPTASGTVSLSAGTADAGEAVSATATLASGR